MSQIFFYFKCPAKGMKGIEIKVIKIISQNDDKDKNVEKIFLIVSLHDIFPTKKYYLRGMKTVQQCIASVTYIENCKEYYDVGGKLRSKTTIYQYRVIFILLLFSFFLLNNSFFSSFYFNNFVFC